MKKRLIAGFAAALALAAPLGAPAAHAQNAVEIGVLKCVVAGGVGFIFGSKGLMYNLTLEGSKFSKLDKS